MLAMMFSSLVSSTRLLLVVLLFGGSCNMLHPARAAAPRLRALEQEENRNGATIASSTFGKEKQSDPTRTHVFPSRAHDLTLSSSKNEGASASKASKGNKRFLSSATPLSGSGSNIIPLQVGVGFPQEFSENDLLKGFKTNTATDEDPFKGRVFEGELYNSKFDSSYNSATVIENMSELTKHMEISGALSITYGPSISGSAEGAYIDTLVQTDEQLTVLYRTRQTAYARSVDTSTIKFASGLDDLDSAAIAEQYGTKFVETVYYGAQLDVQYVFTSQDKDYLFQIWADLRGEVGAGPLTVDFAARFNLTNSETTTGVSTKIKASASGVGQFAMGAGVSFQDVLDKIDDFNQKYKDLIDSAAEEETLGGESNPLNSLSPIAFSLGSIADYTPKLNSLETVILDERMAELSDVFHSALYMKSQLRAERDNQETLYTDARDRKELYLPYKGFVDNEISKLDHTIDQCLKYRRLPYVTIVGRDGSEAAAVPDKYPKGEDALSVIEGLLGRGYIPKPVTVGSTVFDDYYYTGFIVPSHDGSKLPWLGGSLRLHEDKSLLAMAMSPRELEMKGYAAMNNIDEVGFSLVLYGVPVYLESNSLWLTHDSDDNNIDGKDITTESYLSIGPGLWIVRSEKDDTDGGIDEKDLQCVKFGDTVFLQHNETKDFIKFVGDTDPLNGQRDKIGSPWKIRDIGGIKGECVQMNSNFYLMYSSKINDDIETNDDMFLSGGASKKGGKIEIQSEADGIIPRWSFRNDETYDSFTCGAVSAHGKWLKLPPSSGNHTNHLDKMQTVRYLFGIAGREMPPFWQHTSAWEKSVVASVSGGFTVKDKEEVGWVYGAELAELVASALKKNDGDFVWPDDFFWTSMTSINIPSSCIQIREPSCDQASCPWSHNYFCWNNQRFPEKDPGFQFHVWWGRHHYIDGMKCTNTYYNAYHWEDNYLCVPEDSPLDLTFSHKGTIDGLSCIQWYIREGEPQSTGTAWDDTYLCAPRTIPPTYKEKDMLLGEVWQFVFEVEDACTGSDKKWNLGSDKKWNLMTDELVVTANGAQQQPCCLPGFEVDPAVPHGPCRLSSPCFCDQSICDGGGSPFVLKKPEEWQPSAEESPEDDSSPTTPTTPTSPTTPTMHSSSSLSISYGATMIGITIVSMVIASW